VCSLLEDIQKQHQDNLIPLTYYLAQPSGDCQDGVYSSFYYLCFPSHIDYGVFPCFPRAETSLFSDLSLTSFIIIMPNYIHKIFPVTFSISVLKKVVIPSVGVFDPSGMFNGAPVQLSTGSNFLAIGSYGIAISTIDAVDFFNPI